MQSTFDSSAIYFHRPQCDLRVMCGPRDNAFVPANDRREEPGKFFQRAAWKAMSKPRAADEDTERWDGME